MFPDIYFENVGVNQCAIGPNGQAIAIRGSALLTISVANLSVRLEILLADDLGHELIFGMDYIPKYILQINPPTKTLVLENGTIVSMKLAKVNVTGERFLIVAESVPIPGISIKIISAEIVGATKSTRFLCTSSIVPFAEKYNVISLNAVFENQDGKVFVK